jgi:hypothetical protein
MLEMEIKSQHIENIWLEIIKSDIKLNIVINTKVRTQTESLGRTLSQGVPTTKKSKMSIKKWKF